MLNRYLYFICMLVLLCKPAASYAIPYQYCSDVKKAANVVAKTTVADSGENQYDVKYVKLDLNLNNTSISLAGNATTKAQVVAATMNTYTFELDSSLTIDSLLFNGQMLPVTTSGPVRKAALTTSLHTADMFTVVVYYHGTPATSSGFFTGIIHTVSASGVNMVYTVSDPYAARNWWPCKQSLDDKIDSADTWFTIPAGLRAGCNGLLQSVTSPAPGLQTYKWHTQYTIDYYLLCVSVAPYIDYSYYMHFTGSSDSMLIQNYFYDSATFMPAYKANFDSTGMMVDYLSSLYGRYPFYKEKYGHCFTTLSGGMEHQTMTTIGVTTTPLIAHELGHQWFGDHVTYQTWPHVWLSEGFATYTEQLYVEHFWGKTAAANYRKTQYTAVISLPSGSVYVHDTLNTNSLFDQRLVYYKGAGVVHMLRYMAPSDSLFFAVLQQYQKQYAFGLATTEDLKNIAATIYGQNLDSFFNQWIYEQGYPIYGAKWNESGNQKFVQLTQTTSDPLSVTTFDMPVEIKFHSADGADTTIRVFNNQSSQLFQTSWAHTVDSVYIDPSNAIIKKLGTIKYDSTVSVTNITKWQQVHVAPNPGKDFWKITGIQDKCTLQLMDMQGHIIWQNQNVLSGIKVPAGNLATGTYLLQLNDNKGDSTTIRLIHW